MNSPAVTPMQATVYLAPTAHRRYLTKQAAYRAEARARIVRKYPTERADREVGDNGWHWSMLPNADKLLRRYARALMSADRKGQE